MLKYITKLDLINAATLLVLGNQRECSAASPPAWLPGNSPLEKEIPDTLPLPPAFLPLRGDFHASVLVISQLSYLRVIRVKIRCS